MFIKSFKKLIKKYDKITREEIARKIDEKYINKDYVEWNIIKRDLTGFGDVHYCILCRDINHQNGASDCRPCDWMILTDSRCNKGKNSKTYNKIDDANTIEELYQAYKDRAKYMKKVLKEYTDNQLPEIGECPFCNSNSVQVEEHITGNYSTTNYEGSWGYQVKCQNCKAQGAVKQGEENAINAWNAVLRRGMGQDGTGNAALIGELKEHNLNLDIYDAQSLKKHAAPNPRNDVLSDVDISHLHSCKDCDAEDYALEGWKTKWIKCKNCGHTIKSKTTKFRAMAAWNRENKKRGV